MTIIGAGVLYTYIDQVFLLRDKEGFWEIPGGKVSGDESSDETQKREITEEVGSWWDGSLLWNIGIKEGDDIYRVTAYALKEKETPELSDEHTDFGWFSLDKIPRDTRASSLAAIDRLNMRFDQVAKAIADGVFTSPVWYENSCLFAMRISGTSFAIREGPDGKAPEITFRNPNIWTSESMLEAANGLPVVLLHPETLTLTDESFAESIVGTIILPFIRDNELWGVARIVNRPVAEELIANQWSTSPGLIAGKDSPKSLRPDGGVFIYENQPLLLDHLAICQHGVWDKGGPPTGVDSGFNGDNNMNKEELLKKADCLLSDLNARRDSTKKDAVDDDGLEKVISKVSSVKGILEGMADAKNDAADPDLKGLASDLEDIAKEYEKNDATSMPSVLEPEDDVDGEDKKDSDVGGSEMKKEASVPAMKATPKDDACKKDAAPESPMVRMVKSMKAAGASQEDIMACLEAMGMTSRNDADKSEEKKDARKDDKEEKRAAEERAELDRVKSASAKLKAENEALQKRLNEMDRRTRPLSDDETNEISAITARADSAYRSVGSKAPRYVNGELPEAFRRRLAKGLMSYSAMYKNADLGGLKGTNFEIAERQIYADAANYRPPASEFKDDSPLRVIEEDDGKIRRYIGNPRKAFAQFIEV